MKSTTKQRVHVAKTPRSVRKPGVTQKRVGESVLSESQRDEIIQILSQKPRPSYAEVGATVGVNSQVVRRVHMKIEEASPDALAEYGRRLRRRLPIRNRVALYAKIAGLVERNPFAAQRALERIDQLEGILTAKEQRESDREAPTIGALFILPAGSTPSVDAVGDARLALEARAEVATVVGPALLQFVTPGARSEFTDGSKGQEQKGTADGR